MKSFPEFFEQDLAFSFLNSTHIFTSCNTYHLSWFIKEGPLVTLPAMNDRADSKFSNSGKFARDLSPLPVGLALGLSLQPPRRAPAPRACPPGV